MLREIIELRQRSPQGFEMSAVELIPRRWRTEIMKVFLSSIYSDLIEHRILPAGDKAARQIMPA